MNESPPPPLPQTPPAKTSGMAVTSLVLGIVGIATCGLSVLLSAPVGLILGIIALNKIRQSNGQLTGKGMALAGIIMSSVAFLMIPIFAAMLLPAFAQARQKALEIQSMNNEKQLVLSVLLYSGDHTNHFPVANEWCDAIQPEIGNSKNAFKCAAAQNTSSQCDYAFNAQLDGMDVSDVKHPAQTVLLFESDTGWNASGGQELFPKHSRYNYGSGHFVVAFVDGHVESVTPARARSLQWDPSQ